MLVLIRTFTNFGRGIVSSADWWYNGLGDKYGQRKGFAKTQIYKIKEL